jgi:hypothetical protein
MGTKDTPQFHNFGGLSEAADAINIITLILSRAWRDSSPAEYDTALLDPRTCIHEVLRSIYVLTPSAKLKTVRDAEIYNRYVNGETAEDLARAYGMHIQHIRKIIRQVARKAE